MILVLYNCILTALALLALPVVGLALLFRPRYRLGFTQRLGLLPPEVLQRFTLHSPLWVHAPSVGELLATRRFLQALKQAFPTSPILLSCLTPTAYAAAHEKVPEADAIIYFPLDHPVIIARVLRHITPQAFLFTETEMWPNFLSSLQRKGILTILVSGRLSARASTRYRLLSPLFAPIFHNLTRCCMQTQADADRLLKVGVPSERVIVTGNFKVDGITEGSTHGKEILATMGLADRVLLIGASTHPGEEAILLNASRRLRVAVPRLLLLLAPRHPQRFAEVEQILKVGGYRYQKRSQGLNVPVPERLSEKPRHQVIASPSTALRINSAKQALSEKKQALPEPEEEIASSLPAPRNDTMPHTSQTASEIEVFLLDTLGELASFYPGAALVFVGGSLVKGPGGHSVIEPALAQVPVCFGPYTRNFSTVVEELLREGGAFVVQDEDSFCQHALPPLTDVQTRQEAGARAFAVIQRGQGAVERTLAVVRNAIERSCTHDT